MINVAGREPIVELLRLTSDYGKFVAEPLQHGMGTTLGNALRRTLLSSVPGVAIVSARIDGVAHEFTTLTHVHEDMTELILNLKEVAFQVNDLSVLEYESSQRFTARIHAEGKGEVTGADIEIEGNKIEVVNPDLHLATLTHDEAHLLIDLEIETGTGYVPADKHEIPVGKVGAIPVDSVFTPVTRVNHVIESTRVGHQTDLDRLILEIWTNGAMNPKQALSKAALIMMDCLRLFLDFRDEPGEDLPARALRADGPVRGEGLDAKIEELDFSVRTYNCLKKEHIDTIGELVQLSEKALLEIRNLGSKSLTEIREKLAERSMHLADDEG